MIQYLDMIKDVLENGVDDDNRTGMSSRSLFGYSVAFDLKQGFPLVTTKKTNFKNIAIELLWFLKGSTNIKFLKDNNVNIWNEWADDKGDLGAIYGKQWRYWDGYRGQHIDQIANAIDLLKSEPTSRRIVVSAWNVAQLNEMALPPCHVMFQFSTRKSFDKEHERVLDLALYQRSCDVFLGVPYNIASYSLLLIMVAQLVNMIPGNFIFFGGNVHLYKNALPSAIELLTRTPFMLPRLQINPVVKNIDDFTLDDFSLKGYVSHPALRVPVVV